MKNERLEEFMTHVKFLNKDIAEYENADKGCKYNVGTIQLLTRVDKVELTKEELTVAKFNNQVENKDYEMYDAVRVVPKSEITKNDKDKFTLIDKKIKATRIYNVSNQIGIIQSCDTFEEAVELSNEINNKILAL